MRQNASSAAGLLLALLTLILTAPAAAQDDVDDTRWAPPPPGGRVFSGFHLGVDVGWMHPDDEATFDGSPYYDIRWSYTVRENIVVATTIGLATFATDEDVTTMDYDVDMVLPALTIKQHHEIGRSGLNYYFRAGVGYMINEVSDSSLSVDDGVVVPIGIGLEYKMLSDRLSLGVEATQLITEASLTATAVPSELDATLFLGTVTINF
jgi:hypothetical protein